MQTLRSVLIALVTLGTQAPTASPFNAYAVFLNRAKLREGCSVSDSRQFQNRAYSFRGWMHRDTPLVLRDGKAVELNELGKPEWETELVRHSAVTIGGQSAVILGFAANHVGGTGSWGTVLIGTCTNRQLTVIFDAEGQGLGDVAFNTDEVLVVKRVVWSSSDAHCCPSREGEERYRWDRNSGRFARIGAP